MFRIFLLVFLSVSLAQAAETDVASRLKDTLSKKVGDVEQVNKSPITGLYEVVTSDHIFYADESGQYLIDGAMFDVNARRNITEARARKLFAVSVDFNKLPFELALKKVKGNGSRKMAYFTDPNCGWCKKLEKELQGVNDVTLYMFMSTHIGGADSAEKARAVWCSKDRIKAWEDLMLNDVRPAAGKCEAPTDKVMELSKKYRVNGTPALMFTNGVIVPGFLPLAELNKALDNSR
jgi:thiol:disulfide interchange protein DsbC